MAPVTIPLTTAVSPEIATELPKLKLGGAGKGGLLGDGGRERTGQGEEDEGEEEGGSFMRRGCGW
jgi:hypothetical protein